VISFACSIGNVPLAAVLWNVGISFGGVVAFILAGAILGEEAETPQDHLFLADSWRTRKYITAGQRPRSRL
jgi:hypothetical protein